jgi:Cof subfamily protein (haloacid dehalogenase superfamily)
MFQGSSASTIRLIAIDLDGTLLNDRKEVTAKTVRSLACAVASGVRVVIASARPPRSVRAVYNALRLDTWQINYNGALVWDEPSRGVVAHTPLDGALVRTMIDRARRRFDDVLVTCEIIDRWHTDREEQTYTTETGRLFPPDVIAPLDAFCNQPITKLMLLGPPAMMQALAADLAGAFAGRITIVCTDSDLIQITHPDASKGAALVTVAAHYGVPLAQTMAIGDAANDIGMLQAAGVGVAMDNATPAVKAIADWVAPSNNDHGVCAALRRFGVCG